MKFRLWFTGMFASALGVVLLFMPLFEEVKNTSALATVGMNFLVAGLVCLGIAYFTGRRRA